MGPLANVLIAVGIAIGGVIIGYRAAKNQYTDDTVEALEQYAKKEIDEKIGQLMEMYREAFANLVRTFVVVSQAELNKMTKEDAADEDDGK